MTAVENVAVDALAPVRAALLAGARTDVAREMAEATTEAAATLAQAEREANSVRERARALGEADAEAVLAAQRARARRAARVVVLRAQREVYDEVRRKVRASVSALRDDPSYPALRERLVAQARSVFGADATITEDPSGGVVVESPGRRAVYSLAALADRALDAIGTDTTELWAP